MRRIEAYYNTIENLKCSIDLSSNYQKPDLYHVEENLDKAKKVKTLINMIKSIDDSGHLYSIPVTVNKTKSYTTGIKIDTIAENNKINISIDPDYFFKLPDSISEINITKNDPLSEEEFKKEQFNTFLNSKSLFYGCINEALDNVIRLYDLQCNFLIEDIDPDSWTV